MQSIYNQRRLKLSKILRDKKIDSVLFFSRENIRYLCGFTGSTGFFLYRGKSSVFFTDSRYIEQAQKEVEGAKISHANSGILDVCKFLNADGKRSTGIESMGITYDNFMLLKRNLHRKKLIPLINELADLRAIKEGEEIQKIKKATRIAERALESILKLIKIGITERELAIELEYYMKLNGSEELPFGPIILFGQNSSLPHGRPANRRLKKGDFILIDFGARWNGYCSDETVTYIFEKVNPEQVRVYNAVNDARRFAIDSVRPGIRASDVDIVARKHLERKGLARYFSHGLGHGLGLAVHESPRISNNSHTVLEPGMVITIEPGVYIPGWGGVRLEDMVVVTENGAKIITELSKELRILQG